MRNTNGTFAKGNPGGPGRPKRAVEREYLEVMVTAVTPEAWHKIVSKAVEQAVDGDAKAREWIASYVMGKPEAMKAEEEVFGQTAPVVNLKLASGPTTSVS